MHGFSRAVIPGFFIFAAIALWAQHPAPKAVQPSNVRQLGQLQPHHRVEYEIAGGNIDEFTIDVPTGRFIHAVAEQQGVDVVLSILDPAGTVLVAADSPNGTTGPEPASILTLLAGTYRIQISVLDKSAPPGKYSLEITKFRAPQKQDEKELSAERNLFEALRLAEKKDGSENKIIELLQSAVQDWHALGNRDEEELSREALCSAYSGSGNRKEALICFEQTLTTLEMDGDRAGQERMLGVFAVAQYDSGKKQEAFELLQKKLALDRELGNSLGEALTLMAFGFAYSDSSEPQKAVDSYNLALPILRRLKDNNRQATVLGFLGGLYRELGERQKSLEALNQALPIHRSLNDHAGEAKTLNQIGRYYSDLWERPRALELYFQALSIWREVGDRTGEAATLNAIGRIYDDFGESKKALDFYNQSLALRRADGDRLEEANTLGSIGMLYSTLGETQKALELLNQVLALQRTVGNRKGEADALTSIGNIYSTLGDRRKALEYYNQAVPIEREVKDQSRLAVTLGGIGLAYFGLGDNQKALEFYNQALPTLRAADNRVGEATLLNNFGMLYMELGEGSRALEFFHQALSTQRIIGDRIGEIKSLNNIAALYDAADEEQKALEFYNEALSIEREIGYRSAEPAILHNLGNVYFALRENQKALNLMNQALPLERDIGDREGEARTLLNLGAVYNTLGEKAMALDYYKQSLAIEHSIGDRRGEAIAHFLLGRWWEEHNRTLAIFHGKEAVNLFQGLRRDIQKLDKETQKTYLDTVSNAYRSLADMLLSEERLPEAEEVIGMLKEQEFKDFTRGQFASNSSVASLTLGEQRAESILSQGLEWQELAKVANRTPQQEERYEQLGKVLTANNVKTIDFWQALQANMPAMAVHAAKSESAAAQKLLRKLPAGTVVVYTLVLKDKLDLLVIAPQAIVKSTVAVKQADLTAAVETLRSAIRNRNEEKALLEPAHRLYGWLVAPIVRELDGAHATTIAWSLDGVLRFMPINVLHDGERYMIERYTNVIFTPSDMVGLEVKPAVKTWRALGVGISKQYLSTLNPLPGVPGELRAIVHDPQDTGSHGPLPGKILLDDAFTEQDMEQQLQQGFPLVHIASHFVIGISMDDSYLLLGGKKPGDTTGYQLRLSDVETIKGLTFEATVLLSLSACETAISKNKSDGKEVDSLAEIGRQKGAQAVLASLWAVNDDSTAFLMADFYRRWMGNATVSKAEALRAAQLAMLRRENSASSEGSQIEPHSPGTLETGSISRIGASRYSHPYYWAAFILIGNWQ